MRTPVKFICLIVCFTVLVMFSIASADDKKQACPHDKSKMCTASAAKACGGDAAKKEAKKDDPSTVVMQASHTDHAEKQECTHGLKTTCIEDFHTVMSPACHEYIPAGEFDKVRADIPAMLKTAKEIAVYNPGCTYGKDLTAKFDERKAEFIKSMEKLEKASKGDSDKELKQAFESMHMAFAQMNGTLIMRPEGIEEFHNILATMWHEYLPNKKFDEVKHVAPELTTRAQYLTSVELNDDLADHQAQFAQAAKKLHECAQELENACGKDDPELIAQKAEKLHESYNELTATF